MNVYESKTYLTSLQSAALRLQKRAGTVLITGASGLIGSAMADILLTANRTLGASFRVLALGRSEARLRERFSYATSGELAVLAQDISLPVTCGETPDYVVHAASNADPVSYALYPAQTLRTNVEGTWNILDFVKTACSDARVLLTSTFEVYGKKEGAGVYTETDAGVTDYNAVRACYPESKRCAELLLRCCAAQYGVRGVIARLSSVYGPTMAPDDSKAHAQFLRRALAGEDIVLKSDGAQVRSYTYVMDAADALFTLLFSGKAGEAYNVSNQNSVASIREVAYAAAKLGKVGVVFDLPDETEKKGFSAPQDCVLDNGKLRALGWEGRYTLEAGLGETLAVMREIF